MLEAADKFLENPRSIVYTYTSPRVEEKEGRGATEDGSRKFRGAAGQFADTYGKLKNKINGLPNSQFIMVVRRDQIFQST